MVNGVEGLHGTDFDGDTKIALIGDRRSMVKGAGWDSDSGSNLDFRMDDFFKGVRLLLLGDQYFRGGVSVNDWAARAISRTTTLVGVSGSSVTLLRCENVGEGL